MLRFLPWRFIVQRAARAYGFTDPATWLARLRNFAQPSEVAEPIELLRAGILFHARGIVNTKAIQHNLDWVWPYWVERQFDPEDVSFLPRGFAVSHVNLTHRNWTAVGLPDLVVYPLLDPRGLVTPHYDGWSIDFWLFDIHGKPLVPSRLHDEHVWQTLEFEQTLQVRTDSVQDDARLTHTAWLVIEHDQPTLKVDVHASCPAGGSLVVSLRPYNPEGIQFIDSIAARPALDGWLVNQKQPVLLSRPADHLLTSNYAHGDVFSLLTTPPEQGREETTQSECRVGMATAAAIFRFNSDHTDLQVSVPLGDEVPPARRTASPRSVSWPEIRADLAALQIPDRRMQFLYDAALHTLVLLSAEEIVPGPYTYRRFWFRDACLMMNALLAVGLASRCLKAIKGFPGRQLRDGYFRSQEGEWDSNGQVLWVLDRYESVTRDALSFELMRAVAKAVVWIDRKRIRDKTDPLHAGLLPAGFSAEHLGPNDHYYWDDFWAEAGLRATGRLYARRGLQREADDATAKADDLRSAIDRSLERIPAWRSQGGVPASPYRRIDAGAIGSLVADYPLLLYPPGAPQMMATVNALMKQCFFRGGFFQDVIHSGINAYLTLDIAQTLLRAGDARFQELMTTVADLASSTGQWPEAIHPHTGGGCMGDGQHGWAAAEWVMMIRNCFVREETDRLIIGSGLLPQWLATDEELSFGPTLTPWGRVTVRIMQPASNPRVQVDGQWFETPPKIDVEIAGYRKRRADTGSQDVMLEPAMAE